MTPIPAINRQRSGNRFSFRQSGTPYGVTTPPAGMTVATGSVPAISRAAANRTRPRRTPPLGAVGARASGYLAGAYGHTLIDTLIEQLAALVDREAAA